MGLFNALFGAPKHEEKEEKRQPPWRPLVSINQLEEIVEKSNTKTQLIFKHSTSCGISRMVLNTFNAGYDFEKEDFDLYFLDLHSHREVSNETGYRFQVMHQSPQLLVIKNGEAAAHGSHGGINAIELAQYI